MDYTSVLSNYTAEVQFDDLPVEVGELGLLRLGPRLPALQQVVHEHLRPRLAPRTRGQIANIGERALPEQQTRKVRARQSARPVTSSAPSQTSPWIADRIHKKRSVF